MEFLITGVVTLVTSLLTFLSGFGFDYMSPAVATLVGVLIGSAITMINSWFQRRSENQRLKETLRAHDERETKSRLFNARKDEFIEIGNFFAALILKATSEDFHKKENQKESIAEVSKANRYIAAAALLAGEDLSNKCVVLLRHIAHIRPHNEYHLKANKLHQEIIDDMRRLLETPSRF